MNDVMLSDREAGQVVTGVIEVGSPGKSASDKSNRMIGWLGGRLSLSRLISQSSRRTSLTLSSDKHVLLQCN